MKPLKPSHREKRRYLLISGKDANSKAVEASILKFIGVLGYAKAAPMVVKKQGKKLILSVNRKQVAQVRAALSMSGKDMKIEKISGVIGKVK